MNINIIIMRTLDVIRINIVVIAYRYITLGTQDKMAFYYKSLVLLDSQQIITCVRGGWILLPLCTFMGPRSKGGRSFRIAPYPNQQGV